MAAPTRPDTATQTGSPAPREASALRDATRRNIPGIPAAVLSSAWPVLLALAFAVVVQLWLKPFIPDFYAKVLVDIGVSIVLAVSLTMVNGFTGQFSIGHAAFMMVGGYVSAAIVYYGSFRLFGSPDLAGGAVSSMMSRDEQPFMTRGDALYAASLVAGGAFAALCGYLVGLPSLRLKGDYLAIVTLGFGEIVRVLIQTQTDDVLYDADEIAQAPWWSLTNKLGGALGFSGLPFYTSLFWVVAVVSLTLIIAYRIKSSSMGRAFLSIREDEIAAEAMGVDTTKFKVRAFVLSAFFAGVAGGLFAHTVGVTLNPGELGFQKSFDIIIMVVLGGLGSISGAAIAAAIVTVLPEVLRDPGPLLALWPWVVGATVLAGAVAIGARVAGRSSRLWTRLAAFGVAILLVGLLAKWAVSAGIDLGRYRMILFALALILMMILRPQGLFGVLELWDRALWRSGPRRTPGTKATSAGRPA
jgi:branched-chain amino acid transport system permease protein